MALEYRGPMGLESIVPLDVAVDGDSSAGEQVHITLRPNELPRVRTVDSAGLVVSRVVSLADLLTLLDRSIVVAQLKQEATRRTIMPELPPGAILIGTMERPEREDVVVTGCIGARSRAVVVRLDGEQTVHDFPFPPLAYRGVWGRRPGRAWSSVGLSIAVAAEHQRTLPATAETPLYRYPLSNVYGDGGVCWPTMAEAKPSGPRDTARLVEDFIGVPNNADVYGVGHSHNAPATAAGYRGFLKMVEGKGVMPEEWLIPMQQTIEQWHERGMGIHGE